VDFESVGTNVLPNYRTANDKRWWQVSSVLPVELQLKSANWLNVSSIFKRQSSRFELAVTDSRIYMALIGSSVLMTAQNLSGKESFRSVLNKIKQVVNSISVIGYA
jgi:hypothetical protein